MGVLSEEGRKRIGQAASLRLKGRKKDSTHKKEDSSINGSIKDM